MKDLPGYTLALGHQRIEYDRLACHSCSEQDTTQPNRDGECVSEGPKGDGACVNEGSKARELLRGSVSAHGPGRTPGFP